MTITPRIPWVTVVLILLNVAAAFLCVWRPELADQFGFVVARLSVGSIVGSLFIHQNLLHLFGNMVFLAAVGGSLELATGHLRFFIVYFFGGFCGEIAHALAMHSATGVDPLIGASGCIAGCAGYYAIRYWRLRVPLGPNVGAPVWVVVLGWAALQGLGAIVRFGDPSLATSYWAHLGGLVGGALLSVVFWSPDVGQAKLDREVLADLGVRSPAGRAAAAKKLLQRYPRDLQAWSQLLDALRDLEEFDELALGLAKMYDLAGEEERVKVLEELVSMKRVDVLRSGLVLEQAKLLKDPKPLLAEALAATLVDEPEAVFLHGELVREHDAALASQIFEGLTTRWPDHPATRRAIARHWTPAPKLTPNGDQ